MNSDADLVTPRRPDEQLIRALKDAVLDMTTSWSVYIGLFRRHPDDDAELVGRLLRRHNGFFWWVAKSSLCLTLNSVAKFCDPKTAHVNGRENLSVEYLIDYLEELGGDSCRMIDERARLVEDYQLLKPIRNRSIAHLDLDDVLNGANQEVSNDVLERAMAAIVRIVDDFLSQTTNTTTCWQSGAVRCVRQLLADIDQAQVLHHLRGRIDSGDPHADLMKSIHDADRSRRIGLWRQVSKIKF